MLIKTSILFFSFLFSFVTFGQKNNIPSKPTRTAPSKPAVRAAPRPTSSPVSRPSKPAKQPRPAVSRPSKPSSSSSKQQYITKHPAWKCEMRLCRLVVETGETILIEFRHLYVGVEKAIEG